MPYPPDCLRLWVFHPKEDIRHFYISHTYSSSLKSFRKADYRLYFYFWRNFGQWRSGRLIYIILCRFSVDLLNGGVVDKEISKI